MANAVFPGANGRWYIHLGSNYLAVATSRPSLFDRMHLTDFTARVNCLDLPVFKKPVTIPPHILKVLMFNAMTEPSYDEYGWWDYVALSPDKKRVIKPTASRLPHHPHSSYEGFFYYPPLRVFSYQGILYAPYGWDAATPDSVLALPISPNDFSKSLGKAHHIPASVLNSPHQDVVLGMSYFINPKYPPDTLDPHSRHPRIQYDTMELWTSPKGRKGFCLIHEPQHPADQPVGIYTTPNLHHPRPTSTHLVNSYPPDGYTRVGNVSPSFAFNPFTGEIIP